MYEKYVIVGFGWVGQANALALTLLGKDVSYFDPGNPPHHYTEYAATYARLERLEDVRAQDSAHTWYIVCVGDRVSEDGVQDISNIRAALDSLKGVQGKVILRSTIIPDTLASLTFDFYVPEFLHEKKAVGDCVDPYLFVVGKKSDSPEEPSIFAIWRARAHKNFTGTPREAAFIKYLSNLWNATRIAFVNEFGNAIGHPTDAESLRRTEDIIGFLFDHRAYLRYGKSFGGHCLPKDTRAFLREYSKDSPLPLLTGVYASNAQHQQLEKKLPLLPEWYSSWPERHISGKKALHDLWKVSQKYIAQPGLIFSLFR